MSDNTAAPRIAPRAKRRHPRVCVPATAAVFTNQRPLGPCLMEDLSAGGLRLVAGAALRRGRMVSVLLDLPGGEPVVNLAQVCRHELRGPGEHVLALSFVDLRRSEMARIEALVARFLSDVHPCLEFFDTDDGRPRRIVLTDDTPVVG